MTEPRLDPVRIAQLRAYAEGGVQAIDAMAIVTTAMGARRRWTIAEARRSLVLVLMLMGLATVVGIGLVGATRQPTPPQVFITLTVPAIDSLSVTARLHDGRVLIVGSFARMRLLDEALERGEEHPRAVRVPAAWLLDPDTGTVTRTGDPAEPHELAATAGLADGRVLVAGGGPDTVGGIPSAEIYDPTTGRFTPTAPMLFTRSWEHARQTHERPTAVVLDDGRVFIIGGYRGGGIAEVFDPDSATFQQVGRSPICSGQLHLPVRLMDGRVLIRCDVDGDWLFDPVDDSVRAVGATANVPLESRGDPFSTSPVIGESTNLGSASLLTDGRVLFTGRISRTQTGIWKDGPAELYDPVTETFSPPVDATNPSGTRVAVTLDDGRVLLVLEDGVTLVFDPLTESFATLAERPEGIRMPDSATLLDDGRVLILGWDVNGDEDEVVHASVFDPAAPWSLAEGRVSGATHPHDVERS